MDEINASHIVEHLPDPLFTMSEAFRVLKPGGTIEIDVPSTNGPGAFQDPTHKSFWNINSFLYFDRTSILGSLYESDKWDIVQVQEYNCKGTLGYGPFVRALLRKPKDAGK